MSKLVNLSKTKTNPSKNKKRNLPKEINTSRNYIPISILNSDNFIDTLNKIKMKTPYHQNKRKDREYLKNIELLEALYTKHKSGELLCFDLTLPIDTVKKIKKTMSNLLDVTPVSQRKLELNSILEMVIKQSLQYSSCNLVLSNIPEVAQTADGFNLPVDETTMFDTLRDAGLLYRVSRLSKNIYLAWYDENLIAEAVANRLDNKSYIGGKLISAKYIYSAQLNMKYTWSNPISISKQLVTNKPDNYDSEFPTLSK